MKMDFRDDVVPLSKAPTILRATSAELHLAEQLRHAPVQSVTVGDTTWRLCWTADPLGEPRAVVHLRIGAARIAVGLESINAFSEFAGLVDGRAPARLIAAWMQAKASAIWDAIQARSGSAVEVLAFEPEPAEKSRQGRRLGFELSQTDGPRRVRGLVYLQDNAALSLVLALADRSGTSGAGEADSSRAFVFEADRCAVAIKATLGRTILSQRELSDLRTGDTVFVDRQHGRADGELELSVGVDSTPMGGCQVRGRQFLVTRLAPLVRKADMLQSEASGSNGGSVNERFDQLQVELRFEIGSWRTTVGTLRQLGPGAVVELAQPVDGESVTIWVERQCVGRGRVVVVGDRLGVQIVDRSDSSAEPRSVGNAAGGVRRND